MLHSVKLENFGPHEKFEHKFEPGLTLVIGPNGCGKSNILYGTGWTVFGTKALPPEYNQSDIIRDGADSVSTEVIMDLLGQPHTFSRTYDGKNVQATVFRGGEQVATGARGVEEFLAMYGVSWQAASVLFSRQRELDSFVYEVPAKRKEIFESLLRVETVNDARKIANSKRKELTAPEPVILTENRSGALEAEVLDLGKRIIRGDEAVRFYDIALREASDVREAALNVITAASSDDDARRFQSAMRSTQDEIYKLNQRLDIINPTIMNAPVLNPEQVEQATAEVATRIAEIEKGQVDMTTALIEADKLSDIRGRILGRIEAVESTMQKLAEGKCPTCGTEIEDAATHIADVHDVSIEDLQAQKEENHSVACLAAKRIGSIQDALDEAEKVRLELSSELDMFNYAVSLVPEADDLNRQIETKGQEVTEWEEKIRALSGPSPEQRERFSEADALVTKVQVEHREAESDLCRLNTLLGETKELVKLYTEAAAAAEKAEEARKLWATVAKAMDEFRNQVLQSALNWVSLRATQIVRMIGTLPESGPTVRLSLDKNLQFWFTTEDKDVPVYRFSGGQKAVFAICLRMALSEYFSDRLGLKGFLLLDAVFDSLTTENVDATAAALEACGPQQTIIFSHFDVPSMDAHRVRL